MHLVTGARPRRLALRLHILLGMGLALSAAPPLKAQTPDLGVGASLHGKQVLPPDSAWNTDISQAPVAPNSQDLLTSIGLTTGLHANFGAPYNGVPNGIPYIVVPGTQTRVPVQFDYIDQSDPGPYPIPSNAPIEDGPTSTGDRHVVVVDRDGWKSYELYNAWPNAGFTAWTATSGAIFDFSSNAPRPEGWTSADAAGLPIFPGLVRYDEVFEQGAINHALRFTVQTTRHGFVYPARHFASSLTGSNLPPMGMRVRLKASFDISGFPASVRVILTAMKKYGMIVADNGSNWFVSGAPDDRWVDADLHTLGQVHGSDFEVVAMGPVTTDALAVPAQLSAATGTGSIGLKWQAAAGAATYAVKRSTVAGGPYTTILSGITGTTATDTAVTAGATYTYVVSAVAGDQQSYESAPATATVSGADFSISGAPSSQTVLQGAGAAYTITITGSGGFADAVSFGVSGLPAGATASFSPTSVSGAGSTALSVATSASTPAGTYPITVTGVSGTLTHVVRLTLVVTSPVLADFSLSASPTSLTVAQGKSGAYTVTATASGGFSGTVGLAVTGLPSGARASFSPTSLTGSGSSKLTVSTGATTPAGTYALTVTATSGALTHTLPLTLVVQKSSGKSGR